MTHNTEVEEVVKEFRAMRELHEVDKTGDRISQECFWLYHQLQKARHDWLREEIVRLEGMKRNLNPRGQEFQELHIEYNQALQDVQNLYQGELDQERQDKLEVGAKDFAERFLPVMKELAEEELNQDKN